MTKTKVAYIPRPIDRAVFAMLSILHIANAIYLVGPWYLVSTENGDKSPLLQLFNSPSAVIGYGLLLFIDGLVLLYASAGKKGKWYTLLTENALLVGFLLRLYSTIGVITALESWRPPSYLSQIMTVGLLAAYWVHVKVEQREGPIQ